MLRFGTDGIRGDADSQLTSALVVALGRAAARVLGTDRPFLVGRDTRASGPRLEAAFAAGVVHEGGAVESLGVLPTPAVAYLVGLRNQPAAMISASHNPWTDNGIKLFAGGGGKLDDAAQDAIEAELAALATQVVASDAVPVPAVDGLGPYEDHLVRALEGRRLDGLRVVLDCANGAAHGSAPEVFRRLGADVTVLFDRPDGRNINAGCGSTHPETLQAAVPAQGAHLGLALDGDADRVLAVDETGALVDGDQIMVTMALDLAERGRLPDGAIAVTVMSNLGLRRALQAAGIGVVETPVGDRHVVAALARHGLALGGEQSGHIIFTEAATTGDGTLTGLLLADRMARTGRPLSELAAAMIRLPQVLVNVRLAHRPDLEPTSPVGRVVAEVAADLGDRGRVLVRPSGTEPVVRVMSEADTEEAAEAAVARIVAALDAVAAEQDGPGPPLP